MQLLKQEVKKENVVNTKKDIDLDEMFDVSNDEIEELINQELSPNSFNEDVDFNEIANKDVNENVLLKQKNDSISQVLTNKSIIEEEMENINLKDNETFYEAISNQIEDLFNKYPAENNLEQLIPNSKWVKIDYENDGNFYVLGLIYEDITLKYICYGVPGTYSEVAPNGLDSYSQWLPTNLDSPTENGYWVMYQDAISGESVLVDAI